MTVFDAKPRFPGSADTINKINYALSSRGYIAIIAALTLLSNTLGLELPVYAIFAAITVYVCLWGDDLMGLVPIVAMGYLTPSAGNNPGRSEASVFSVGHGGVFVILMGLTMAAAVVYRVIRDREVFLHKKRPLLTGMLILSAAYLLGGIGSKAFPDYWLNHTVFALLQGASITLPYWLFTAGINWKERRKDYFAWLGCIMGMVLVLQIFRIYLTGEVIVNGIIERDAIYTGWGMYNNIGAMLAMMIPFSYYLAIRLHKDWMGTIGGGVLLLFVFLTCSRNSILAATAIYFFCFLLMLYSTQHRKRSKLAPIICICSSLLVMILFHKQLLQLFNNLLEIGFNPSSRDIIYKEGLKLFGEAPIFGNSFFSPGYQPWDWSTVNSFSGFFPPRWHNTLVQILASCGLVGLCAYCLHTAQIVNLFLSHFTKERVFIACSVAVLIGCSMFDCHFFNVGPTLFYSIALAFAECCKRTPKKKLSHDE